MNKAVWLRVAVLAVCAGEASRAVRFENEIFSWLTLEVGAGEPLALGLVHGTAWALLAAGVLQVFVRSRVLWLGIAAWLAGLAAAKWWDGGVYAEWTPAAHATRWLAPVAAVLWHDERPRSAEMVARLAVAATFAAHGYEALTGHGEFVDYLLTVSGVVGIDLGQDPATSLLAAIGVVDVAVALLVLASRWRVVAAWMALWGAATACVRLAEYGVSAYDKVLVRVPNALLPLWLLLRWRRSAGEG